MRRRRTADDRRIAGLHDDLARLRAQLEGLETEKGNLEREEDGLREKAAAAFIGELAEEDVQRERDRIEGRLAAVLVQLDDLRGLVAPIQRRLCEAQLRQAEESFKTAELDERIAVEAVTKAEAALAEAQAVHAETEAALEAADEARDRVAADLAAVVHADPDDLDPLATAARRREHSRAEIDKQRSETVAWWGRQSPWRIERECPATMREEALAVAARRAEVRDPERAREQNVEAALRSGDGYSECGEMIVQPGSPGDRLRLQV